MGFIKCPRCELNYIREEEQYCSVCKREMRGEEQEEIVELCSVCNENPVMPGKDICYACFKEMAQNVADDDREETEQEREEVDLDMDDVAEMEDVSEMEEIELDDGVDSEVPEDIGVQISLEEERSREEEASALEDAEDED